jgi:hypothetical protein
MRKRYALKETESVSSNKRRVRRTDGVFSYLNTSRRSELDLGSKKSMDTEKSQSTPKTPSICFRAPRILLTVDFRTSGKL